MGTRIGDDSRKAVSNEAHRRRRRFTRSARPPARVGTRGQSCYCALAPWADEFPGSAKTVLTFEAAFRLIATRLRRIGAPHGRFEKIRAPDNADELPFCSTGRVSPCDGASVAGLAVMTRFVMISAAFIGHSPCQDCQRSSGSCSSRLTMSGPAISRTSSAVAGRRICFIQLFLWYCLRYEIKRAPNRSAGGDACRKGLLCSPAGLLPLSECRATKRTSSPTASFSNAPFTTLLRWK